MTKVLSYFTGMYTQNQRLVKFLICGSIGAAVKLGLMFVLVESGLFYVLSYGIAFIASVVVNYVLNSAWTYKEMESNLAGLGKLLIVASCTLVLNEAVLIGMVEGLGIWYMIGAATGILTTALVNFVATKKFVWNKVKNESSISN